MTKQVEQQTDQTSAAAVPVKRPYEPPLVKPYGPLADLTQAGLTGTPDTLGSQQT